MLSLSAEGLLLSIDQHISQLQNRQILEPTDPHVGALVHNRSGLPEAQSTAGFLTSTLLLALMTGGTEKSLIDRACLAADSLEKLRRRPSGLFDLVTVNPDSAPDTGFILQHLCGSVELVRNLANTSLQSQLNPLVGKIETVIHRSVPPMLTGGFHTPNHRWVMISALAQAIALFPDLDASGAVSETIRTYLAEGFDIDEEGAFIERSVGVYDAVNTRSLLLLAAHWPDDETRNAALKAVRRNIDFDFHLLHADGSAETGLSRRQDYGTRSIAVGLIPTLLLYNRAVPSPDCLAMTHHLWQQNLRQNGIRLGGDLTWILYSLLRSGDPKPTADATELLPVDFARYYPRNGIWRVRRGLLSASAFEGVTRLFGLTYGQAELTSLKISYGYFGGACGHFVSNSLTTDSDGRARLRSQGTGKPRRPGYELPVGHPVPPDEWDATLAERQLRDVPPIVSELAIAEVKPTSDHNNAEKDADVGFDYHFQTLSGLDDIACQIALDFPVGGVWETADTRLQPAAGQLIFLKKGWGEMRYSDDVIRIESGAFAHGMWNIREAETAPDHVRILVTLKTPIDFCWRICVYRGLG